jgi:hypothetical protein
MGISADGSTILRTELDNVMSQQVWPNMDDLIGGWAVMLTAKDMMASAASHGPVQAHIGTNHAQRSKPIYKNTSALIVGNQAICMQRCEEALSKCSKCSGSHHTSMHEDVQNLRRERNERLEKNKQKTLDANLSTERISRLALNAKVKRESDVNEYAALLDAIIAVEELMKNEDNKQSLFINELEQNEVIFDTGCTAHILRCAEGLFDIRIAPTGSCITLCLTLLYP